VGKINTKWGPDEKMMEVALFDPNFHNPESDFVNEGGQKRVYPYEAGDVKVDYDIVQACHTDTRTIIS